MRRQLLAGILCFVLVCSAVYPVLAEDNLFALDGIGADAASDELCGDFEGTLLEENLTYADDQMLEECLIDDFEGEEVSFYENTPVESAEEFLDDTSLSDEVVDEEPIIPVELELEGEEFQEPADPILEESETVIIDSLDQVGTVKGTCGDNLTWMIENETLIISGNGEMTHYRYHTNPLEVVPPWYQYKESIKTVDIRSGVRSIGAYAFNGLDKVTHVYIADTVNSIGAYAFLECSSLTSVSIPKDVSYLTSFAFAYCVSLRSIYLPLSITFVGQNTFDGCSNLRDVYYEGSEENWRSVEIVNLHNDALFNATMHYLAGDGSINLVPVNGAQGVHFTKSGTFIAEMIVSGSIEKGYGHINLYRSSNDQLLYSIDVSDPGIAVEICRDWEGNQEKITSIIYIPLQNLVYNSQVYILVDKSCFLSNGKEFGISSKEDWTFTTTKHFFAYGEETFNFINNGDDLGFQKYVIIENGEKKEKNYLNVNWDIVGNEINRFNAADKTNMKKVFLDNTGCCFGFSVLALMDYYGMIDNINNNLGEINIHGWDRAADNPDVCAYLASYEAKQKMWRK